MVFEAIKENQCFESFERNTTTLKQTFKKKKNSTSLIEGPSRAKQKEERLISTGLGGIRDQRKKVTRLGVGWV
jgi:F0F1-type ATP synthase delta subunit